MGDVEFFFRFARKAKTFQIDFDFGVFNWGIGQGDDGHVFSFDINPGIQPMIGNGKTEVIPEAERIPGMLQLVDVFLEAGEFLLHVDFTAVGQAIHPAIEGALENEILRKVFIIVVIPEKAGGGRLINQGRMGINHRAIFPIAIPKNGGMPAKLAHVAITGKDVVIGLGDQIAVIDFAPNHLLEADDAFGMGRQP